MEETDRIMPINMLQRNILIKNPENILGEKKPRITRRAFASARPKNYFALVIAAMLA
jgi:hypothetical protein